MSYKLIKEHPTHFEVAHPDGSKFNIAKSSLHPKLQDKVRSMPVLKMAEGGEVPEQEDAPSQAEPSEDVESTQSSPQVDTSEDTKDSSDQTQAPSVASDLEKQVNDVKSIPDEATPTTSAQGEVNKPTAQPRVYGAKVPDIASQSQPQDQGLLGQLNSAVASQKQGINARADVQSQYGNAVAATIQKEEKDRQDIQASYSKAIEDNLARKNAIIKSIGDGSIDPNRYIGNMSTLGKITTALSVALSGIGSGLSGKPNMAMGVVEDAIKRDMQAQERELGKKENLLSQNLKEYGDLNIAKQQTLNDMRAMTQGKLQALAAQSGSAQAKAEAQILNSQLDQKYVMEQGPIAMQQMGLEAMKNMQSGGSVNRQALEMLPQFKGKTVALPNGKVGLAATPEGAKHVSEAQAAVDDLNSTLERMEALEKRHPITGTLGAHIPYTDIGISSSEDTLARQLQSEAIAKVNHVAGLTRLSEVDTKLLLRQIPNPGSMRGDTVRAQIQEMRNNIGGHMNALYKANLTNYNPDKPANAFKAKEGAPILGKK